MLWRYSKSLLLLLILTGFICPKFSYADNFSTDQTIDLSRSITLYYSNHKKMKLKKGTKLRVIRNLGTTSGKSQLSVVVMSGPKRGRSGLVYLADKADKSVGDQAISLAPKAVNVPEGDVGKGSTPQALSDNDLQAINKNIADIAVQLRTMPQTEVMQNFDPNKEVSRIGAIGTADNYSPHDAASCTSKDMSSDFGENRNQDGLGWCFAETAADLLSQKLGQRVSMLDMSFLYYQQNNIPQRNAAGRDPDNWIGGSTAYTVAAIAHRGTVCSDSEMPDDFSQAFMARPLAPGEDITSRLNRVNSLVTSFFGDIKNATKNKSANDTCRAESDLQEMFPTLDAKVLVSALEAVENEGADILTAVNWLRNLGCKHPITVPHDLKMVDESAPVDSNNNFLGLSLMKSIDENLDQDHAVGIGYNEAPFKNSNWTKASGVMLHASSIIGRKFIDGKCQYLVRNSYGRSCVSTRPCSKGNFWITEQDIGNYVQAIQYFK